MPSSTSSSEYKSIDPAVKKIFIWALAFIAAYCLLIELWQPDVVTAQNQRDKSTIRAERFLFNNSHATTIITGSSLSTRLPTMNHNNTIYNLSFEGGIAMTGIEILLNSESNLSHVLIEINTLDRSTDHGLIRDLFRPEKMFIKKYIKASRTEFHPINIMTSALQFFYKLIAPPHRKENKKTLQNSVSIHIKQYKEFANKPIFDRNLDILSYQIQQLQQKGIEVIFFEMPIDSRLRQTHRVLYMKDKLQQRFPVTQYRWLTFGHLENLQTTDGIHLAPHSAARVTQALITAL